MKTLSNHTVEYLDERINYTRNLISKNKESKLDSLLEKDLMKFLAMKSEAENRIVVGYDIKDEALVYMTGGIVYVEGKPSGWRRENMNFKFGENVEVCYDGGTNWTGILKIN
jgi:hypothetical protein